MTRRKAVQIVRPPITWILVADGRQAQVYIREKVEKLVPLASPSKRNLFAEAIAREPVPVPGMRWEAEPVEHYQVGRNATGMVFESASSARHMAEPHIDARQEVKDHFARTIAERLNRAKLDKLYDRLVLIAPPKMLGEIKKYLEKRVLKQIVAEMPKDLTYFDAESLAEHLGRIV